MFAQVLRAIEDRGEREVANDVAAALTSGEPIQLAVRARASADPRVTSDELPSSLASIEVVAATAADYDVLLGGVQ